MVKRRALPIREIERENRRLARRGALESANDTRLAGERPKTRGECAGGPRPCPWVGCRYNLFLDVTSRGAIQLPDGEPADALREMDATCALDVAGQGGIHQREVAAILRLSTFGASLVERRALAKLAAQARLAELSPEGRLQRWAPDPGQSGAMKAYTHSRAQVRKFLDANLERKEPAQ